MQVPGAFLQFGALDSTRRCNGSLKSTGRRFVVPRLSRSRVQADGDGIQISLAVDREVFPLGQMLTHQSIGVLVRSPLPRASRITEEHIDLGVHQARANGVLHAHPRRRLRRQGPATLRRTAAPARRRRTKRRATALGFEIKRTSTPA